jgi:hypothetical protein
MNFLNMFSDEAPISNSGYRSSLYTDPSIAQGVKYLNYERDIKNNLSENLKLISKTDGSGLGSGKVINGKIYEGMETSQSSTPDTPDTTSTDITEQIKNADIENLKLGYSFLTGMYDEVLKNFSQDYQGGIANSYVSANGTSISAQRQELVKLLQNIQGSISTINVQISDVVKQRSKVNIQQYYKIMDEIRDVKNKLIKTNNEIINLTRMVDPTSAIAEREETHILSKQRYYMYIFWFIITAIVIYVMIANMFNPDSSFSVLVICLIILVCIFGFFVYDKITGSWYYSIKNGIRNISIPRIGNIVNFDPLVSIKYTS